MIKNLLLATLVAQGISAQIISKDQTFAANGIYSITENMAWSRITQNSDGSIFFTYDKASPTHPGSRDSFLSKLTVNGIIDSSFGTNGTIQTPYYSYNSEIKKQPDGKLLIYGFSDTGASVSRILPNGQPDSTFGNNGTVIIPALYADGNNRSYGLLLQNDKIIVHGIDDPDGHNLKHRIYRLNSNGTIDPTFGTGGTIFTGGSWSDTSFVLTDTQSNIITLTNSGIMKKFNSNGYPITSFGNNGVLQMSSGLGFAGTVIMDSNNKIVYSNLNDEIFRINADGTPDTTFTYNLPAYSGTNGGAWILNITEKDDYYYIGGNGEIDLPSTPFISRLTQNGNIDPSFSYYSESDSNLSGAVDMIVNNNSIITIGSSYIAKYITNNATLATKEITAHYNNNIAFENPIKQNLIYSTKETVESIDIYSSDSKLIKNVKNNNSDVSELPTGLYIVKIKFTNGKETMKKLMKN